MTPPSLQVLMGAFLVACLASCSDSIGSSGSSADPREHEEVVKFLPGEDRKFIEEAETVMLHRLHPYPYASGRPKEGVERFHGYEILGTTEVEDAEIREALVVDLYRGIASSDGTVAACFSPRHGVRFTRGSDAIDLVICFECLQVKAYKGEQQRSALTTRLPEATYRFALRRAGIDIKEDE